MATAYDVITEKLEEFYKSEESVRACMIIDEQVEGILVIPETFKEDVVYAWDAIEHIIKNQVKIMKKYGLDGLVQINFNVLEFGVMMYLLGVDAVLMIVTDKTELGPELVRVDHKTRGKLIPELSKHIRG